MPDLPWLALLGGLFLVTLAFVRLCEKGDFTHLAEDIKSHQPRK